jgi:hypothetical protein
VIHAFITVDPTCMYTIVKRIVPSLWRDSGASGFAIKKNYKKLHGYTCIEIANVFLILSIEICFDHGPVQ